MPGVAMGWSRVGTAHVFLEVKALVHFRGTFFKAYAAV